MGNGVSGNQGNLPSHGSRDVGDTPDRKRHDWFEQAEAPNANTPTQSGVKPYNTLHFSAYPVAGTTFDGLYNFLHKYWWN